MIIDACYKSGPITNSGKIYKQDVTLKFFDSHSIDIVISDFSDESMFPESHDKMRRCPIEVTAFDKQIQFLPHGKAFDVITDAEWMALWTQPIMVLARPGEPRNNNASRYSTPTAPRKDQYVQDCILIDPATMTDTRMVAPVTLVSEKSAYESGFYRAEIYFDTRKDKYGSPIPTVKIAGLDLGQFYPDLAAIAT